ncbi:hypothetical protein [Aureimonas leprariae]|uniref:Uncharacterized protein n=1 Tax=Plantimonas leprariae TaxID=2615207 RepID=A0A7V7PK94_9HYPH|nr:hypothetical protein [Aureimonas leprariae]KAB0676028.1 hypothetical protein F6X38_22470 [Aureimonas leprariae]
MPVKPCVRFGDQSILRSPPIAVFGRPSFLVPPSQYAKAPTGRSQMTDGQLSPDEQRALAALCADQSLARFLAPNFMRHLESLGLVERLNGGVIVSDEGRRRAEGLRSAYSF